MDRMEEISLPGKNIIEKMEIKDLFHPRSIRLQSQKIFQLAQAGHTNFILHPEKFENLADFICQITCQNFPTLNIPFHSHWVHFQCGNQNRLAELEEKLENHSKRDITKAKISLILITILLQSVSGPRWRYKEEKKEFFRSEGQTVACFRMFMSGLFSSNANFPYQVDGEKLTKITLDDLEKGFQSTSNNLLTGLETRLELLHKLAHILEKKSDYFEGEQGNIGNLLDYFSELSSLTHNQLSTIQIFQTLHDSIGSLWPGVVEIDKINLGDTWMYKPLGAGIDSLIPFHRLAQWCTYSLLEPLSQHGIVITNIKQLTGLPEYRNCGLMLDSGVLELKDPKFKDMTHAPESELIVEWRALTVILLDQIAKIVAEKLRKTTVEFPLIRVLEGGTWWSGRAIAQKLRDDGGPPLKVSLNNMQLM